MRPWSSCELGAEWAEVVQLARQQGLTEQSPESERHGDGCGQWHCHLCERTILTVHLQAHLESKKHKSYLSGAQSWCEGEPAAPSGDPQLPEWLEVHDGEHYCTLCHAYATDAHLRGAKHLRRLSWWQWQPDQGWESWKGGDPWLSRPSLPGAAQGSSPTADDQRLAGPLPEAGEEAPPEWWGDARFYSYCEGWWRCRLCSSWADDKHVTSQKHRRRAQHPGYYLDDFPCEQQAEERWPACQRRSSDVRLAISDLPAPWRSAWSEEHCRYYYFNELTREATWEIPEAPQATRPRRNKTQVLHTIEV